MTTLKKLEKHLGEIKEFIQFFGFKGAFLLKVPRNSALELLVDDTKSIQLLGSTGELAALISDLLDCKTIVIKISMIQTSSYEHIKHNALFLDKITTYGLTEFFNISNDKPFFKPLNRKYFIFTKLLEYGKKLLENHSDPRFFKKTSPIILKKYEPFSFHRPELDLDEVSKLLVEVSEEIIKMEKN